LAAPVSIGRPSTVRDAAESEPGVPGGTCLGRFPGRRPKRGDRRAHLRGSLHEPATIPSAGTRREPVRKPQDVSCTPTRELVLSEASIRISAPRLHFCHDAEGAGADDQQIRFATHDERRSSCLTFRHYLRLASGFTFQKSGSASSHAFAGSPQDGRMANTRASCPARVASASACWRVLTGLRM